jgi:hypothetical protein
MTAMILANSPMRCCTNLNPFRGIQSRLAPFSRVGRRAVTLVRRGAAEVARTALGFALPAAVRIPVLVNGAAGVVAMIKGRPFSVMGFTVVGGKIVEIECILDPKRLSRLDLAPFGDAS